MSNVAGTKSPAEIQQKGKQSKSGSVLFWQVSSVTNLICEACHRQKGALQFSLLFSLYRVLALALSAIFNC